MDSQIYVPLYQEKKKIEKNKKIQVHEATFAYYIFVDLINPLSSFDRVILITVGAFGF